jgi:hypothetical protein
MDHCAPSASTIDRSFSCFSLLELKTIANTINDYISNNKPVCKGDTKCTFGKKKLEITEDKKQLWYEIYSYLLPVCSLESCWVDTNVLNSIPDRKLRNQLKFFTVKPKMREMSNYWLSTGDINYVMRQYSKLYPKFYFVGTEPSDFYKFDKPKIEKWIYYDKIGMVLNHDKSDEPGSHWVALLIDNIARTIEYYDSVGEFPIYEINLFINKLKKHFPQYKIKINNKVHQRENSECGVYSIYFLVQRILGYTFEDIINNIITDKNMENYRRIIFDTNEERIHQRSKTK